MSRIALTLMVATLLGTGAALAQSPSPQDASLAARVPALVPKIEAEVARGMKLYDIPGVAVGIVAGDKLVYAKGFGTRAKGGSAPVDTKTVFQIGSATKAFLATTMAIAADEKKFAWTDRVEDLAPEFQFKDPWVTREMRMFDIIAQRSGLPPYANDGLSMLGYDVPAMIRSLRFVEPASSFRSTFTYTNITHTLAGEIIARLERKPDWNAVVKAEILDPLGMKDTTATAEAMLAAPNHANGYLYVPGGSVEVPFDPSFPYRLGPAGNLNSNVEDAARWVRLQSGDGMFEGKRLVSAENLAVTRTPRVGMSDTSSYAMGWVVTMTPNGRIVWHNGGTIGFGTHIGFLPGKDFGVIVLSNVQNTGFPDSIAMGIYDAVLGNPPTDHLAAAAERAKAGYEAEAKKYERRPNASPAPAAGSLAGTYLHPALGEATVAADGDGLLVTLVRTGAKLRLSPFDGPVFVVRQVPEGPFEPIVRMANNAPTGFMQFTAGADGTVSGVSWLYDDVQTYRFARK